GLQKQFGDVPPLILCRAPMPAEAFRDELRKALADNWSEAARIRPALLASAAAQIRVNDAFRERVFDRLQARLQ
ncbi:MAG: hypothetical protein JOY92_16805, partial [Verrucomicrobia bacterium]|nr:hypothetical protein [Verrucomicrobiota bacterium]